MSVAGKRAGLDGERSGLFMEQIRIIKELREHDRADRGSDVDIRLLRPRFMVWENVCGAFSSNKGEDFRAVLEETAKIVCEDAVIPRPKDGKWTPSGCIMGNGWSIAWRVHDAQFWGVPQRRKRIALVADFGGESAPQILFERESVSGDSSESGEERENSSRTAEDGVNPSSYTLKIRGGVEVDSKGKKAGKGPLIQTELSATLGVSQDQTLITGCLNPWDVQSKHVQPESGVAESLYSGECRYGGGESYVMQGINGDVAGTLDASYYKGCGERQGIEREVVMQDVYGFEPGVAKRLDPENRFVKEKIPTLRANMGDNQTAVVYGISPYESNAMKSSNPNSGIYEAETARTLDLNGGSPACNQGGMAIVCIDQGAGKSAVSISEEQSPTLATTHDGAPAVCYGIDRAAFNQGQNAQYDFSVEEEKAQTIVARGPGGGY